MDISCVCVLVLKSLQSCPAFCDPMDYSLPGYSVHGILQARILEWVTMPSSKGSSQPRDRTQGSNSHLLCLLHWQMCSLSLLLPGHQFHSSCLSSVASHRQTLPSLSGRELPPCHRLRSSQSQIRRISFLVQHRAKGPVTHFHVIYGRFWYLRWSSII